MSELKKLGLIGGTGPESTLIYYRRIIEGVQAATTVSVCGQPT